MRKKGVILIITIAVLLLVSVIIVRGIQNSPKQKMKVFTSYLKGFEGEHSGYDVKVLIDTIKLKLEDDTSFSVMYELLEGANAKIEHVPGMSKDRFLQDIDALRVVLGDNKKYNIEFIYQDKDEKCIKQINIVEVDN